MSFGQATGVKGLEEDEGMSTPILPPISYGRTPGVGAGGGAST